MRFFLFINKFFFEINKYGVILEDDVIISNRCIELFYIFLLDNKNDKFMSLSSFNEFNNKKKEAIYRIPVWRSWGWASWDNQWKLHLEFSKRIKSIWYT